MANLNEFIIEVGAELNKNNVKQIAKDFKSQIANSKADVVIIKAEVDTKAAKSAVRELQSLLSKGAYRNKVKIDYFGLDSITNFEKRIGMLRNKLSQSGLDKTSSQFKDISATINQVSNALKSLGEKGDTKELSKQLNAADVSLDEMVRSQQDFRRQTKESNAAIIEYTSSLKELNRLQLELFKEEARVKSNPALLDSDKSKAYVNQLRTSISMQEKEVEVKRQVSMATAGAERTAAVYAKAQQNLATAQSKVTATGKNQLSMLESIKVGFKDAFARITNYTLAYKAITFGTQKLRESVEVAKELDATMVDLQIVANGTRSEVEDLMMGYSGLAKELGVTTIDVANSANEFIRMGYEGSQAQELLKNATTLSVLGMIEQDEATKYLTAAMKGYGVAVEDTSKIVDKATAIDLKYAVSSGYILEAMSRTASSAKLAGVEMSKLMAIIAVVGETTQKSAESIELLVA